MKQVLYDTNTGLVLQWQDLDRYGYPPNPPGTATLEVTDDQWNAQQQSSQWFVINGQLTPEIPLDFARKIQLDKIKGAFKIAFTQPYQSNVLGKMVDFDTQSLLNVQGLVTFFKNNPTVTSTQFRCADNSFVSITLTQAQELLDEMIAHGQSLYQHKWELEQQIQNATSVEQIQSIVW